MGTTASSSRGNMGGSDGSAAGNERDGHDDGYRSGNEFSFGGGVVDGDNSNRPGTETAGGEGQEGNNDNDNDVSGWEGLLEVDLRCSGSGNCPLHDAAASGSVGAVLSLLDLGADIAITNGRGDTALHVAVGPEAPRDPEDEGRSWGSSSSLASTSMSAPTLLTMSSTTDVSAPGSTPFYNGGERPSSRRLLAKVERRMRGRRSRCEVVTALLRRRADPSRKDGKGRTAAMCAVLAGRAGALRELRKAARCWPSRGEAGVQLELSELSRVAISEGHVCCLRVLTHGCSEQDVLAWVDEDGLPALSLAVAHGQRECIDILLSGASPASLCGGGGNTVLHVTAMSHGGVPVLKRLMSSRGGGEPFDPAWLERRNDLGDTIAMAALRAGRHAAALLLFQALAVPTAAAHTFRYAWVIAAALRSAELCPCPSCVLGRTAEERARLCSKVATKSLRPGEQRLGSSATSHAGNAGVAARRRSVAFAARGNSIANKVSS
ncbi:unnamed protein product, partial [Hapterophycus canaliculatus]